MEKHDKILMLTKSNLNSIVALLSHALFDMEKSHEEFATIWMKEISTKKMKEECKWKTRKYETK